MVNLNVTPDKGRSFLGNLIFSVSEFSAATIATFYPTGAGIDFLPYSSQKVQYDGSYFYLTITKGSESVDQLVKISEDFSTIHTKRYGGQIKNTSMWFNSSAQDNLLVLAAYNPNSATYGEFGYRHHYYVFDSENSGTHLDPVSPYYDEKHYLVGAVSGNQMYPNGVILNASDDVIIYGASFGTRYNYIRYNSAGVYQFAGRVGHTNVVSAIYANSAMYAVGGSSVQKINPTTDSIAASYNYTDSAQNSTSVRDVILDSNSKIVVVGYQVDGGGQYTSWLAQLENDLTAKNYNVQITQTTNNLLYEGVFEYDGFIFATGRYVDGGNTYAVISKFALSDLSHIATIRLADTTYNYARFLRADVCNNNIICYGSVGGAGGNEGAVIKIKTSDIAGLNGSSDDTGRFAFSTLSITETNPGTASWTSNGYSMTASTIEDYYTSTDLSSARAMASNIYNF